MVSVEGKIQNLLFVSTLYEIFRVVSSIRECLFSSDITRHPCPIDSPLQFTRFKAALSSFYLFVALHGFTKLIMSHIECEKCPHYHVYFSLLGPYKYSRKLY